MSTTSSINQLTSTVQLEGTPSHGSSVAPILVSSVLTTPAASSSKLLNSRINPESPTDALTREILELLGQIQIDNKFNTQNEHLVGLEEKDSLFKLVKASKKNVKLVFTSAKWCEKQAKSSTSFLESVFPQEILTEYLNLDLKLFQDHLSLGSTFIKATESGLSWVVRIIKRKILNESKSLIQQVKDNCRKNHQSIPEAVQEWEKTVLEESNKLDKSYIKDTCKTAKGLTSGLKSVFKYLPDFPCSSVIKKTLSQTSSSLDLILTAMSFAKTTNNYKVFTQARKNFRSWQEDHTNRVTIDIGNQTKLIPAEPLSQALDRIVSPQINYETLLNALINQCKDMDQIKQKLSCYNIVLNFEITSKEEFIQCWNSVPAFKNQLITEYSTYQEKLEKLDHIILSSTNLLQKREAILEKKLIQLRPQFESLVPAIQKIKKLSFEKELIRLKEKFINSGDDSIANLHEQFRQIGIDPPPGMNTKDDIIKYLTNLLDNRQALELEYDILFKQWFFNQSCDSLLKSYIDHQETIERTLVPVLQQMVDQKYKLEHEFTHFERMESVIKLAFLIASLTITTILHLLAFTSIAFTGAGLIGSVFYSLSIISSFGLIIKSYKLYFDYKPSGFGFQHFLSNAKLVYNKLRASKYKYSLLFERKKRDEAVQAAYQLHFNPTIDKNSEEYREGIARYKKIRADYEEMERKCKYWQTTVENIENELESKAWQDFAEYANPSTKAQLAIYPNLHRDTLKTLNEAFKNCNLSLWTPSSNEFLERFLGINAKKIKKKMEKNPLAMTKIIQSFFISTNSKFLSLLKGK